MGNFPFPVISCYSVSNQTFSLLPQDLSEIAHLNLGFNQMETLPALGLVARTNLKSLSLKNNNLESLAGLEDYSSLEVLDVATNCIFDRMELRMLGYLHSIKAVSIMLIGLFL